MNVTRRNNEKWERETNHGDDEWRPPNTRMNESWLNQFVSAVRAFALFFLWYEKHISSELRRIFSNRQRADKALKLENTSFFNRNARTMNVARIWYAIMYFVIVLASARFIHFDVLYAYRKGVPFARNGITLLVEWGKYETHTEPEV